MGKKWYIPILSVLVAMMDVNWRERMLQKKEGCNELRRKRKSFEDVAST